MTNLEGIHQPHPHVRYATVNVAYLAIKSRIGYRATAMMQLCVSARVEWSGVAVEWAAR